MRQRLRARRPARRQVRVGVDGPGLAGRLVLPVYGHNAEVVGVVGVEAADDDGVLVQLVVGPEELGLGVLPVKS